MSQRQKTTQSVIDLSVLCQICATETAAAAEGDVPSGLEEHLADPTLGEHVQDGDRDGEEETARDREEAHLDAANLVDAHEFLLDGIVVAERVGADVHAWRSLKKSLVPGESRPLPSPMSYAIRKTHLGPG